MQLFEQGVREDKEFEQLVLGWRNLYQQCCCGRPPAATRLNNALDRVDLHISLSTWDFPLLPGDLPPRNVGDIPCLSDTVTKEAVVANLAFLGRQCSAPLHNLAKKAAAMTMYSEANRGTPEEQPHEVRRRKFELRLLHAFFAHVCARCGQQYRILGPQGAPGRDPPAGGGGPPGGGPSGRGDGPGGGPYGWVPSGSVPAARTASMAACRTADGPRGRTGSGAATATQGRAAAGRVRLPHARSTSGGAEIPQPEPASRRAGASQAILASRRAGTPQATPEPERRHEAEPTGCSTGPSWRQEPRKALPAAQAAAQNHREARRQHEATIAGQKLASGAGASTSVRAVIPAQGEGSGAGSQSRGVSRGGARPPRGGAAAQDVLQTSGRSRQI